MHGCGAEHVDMLYVRRAAHKGGPSDGARLVGLRCDQEADVHGGGPEHLDMLEMRTNSLADAERGWSYMGRLGAYESSYHFCCGGRYSRV